MSFALPLKPACVVVVCLVGLVFTHISVAQRPRKLPKPSAYKPRKAPPRVETIPKTTVVPSPTVPQRPVPQNVVPQGVVPLNPVQPNAVPLTTVPNSGSSSTQPVPDSQTPVQKLPVQKNVIIDPSGSTALPPLQKAGTPVISDLNSTLTNPAATNSAVSDSVSEVPVAAEPKPIEPSPYDFTIEPAHQSLIFGVSHFGYSYTYGRFNKVTGGFTFDKNDPTSGEFEFAVDVNSIDTNDKKRDTHLLGPDFFDAAKFPAIKFKSLGVVQANDRMQISGLLTMHGKTKQVRIPMQHVGEGDGPGGKYRSGFNSQFVIRRSDFGMKTMLPSVGNEISITFSFEGIKNPK